MQSSTLFVNLIILNTMGTGWFYSPRIPKQLGNGFNGTRRGQATCHKRKMPDFQKFVRFGRGFELLRVFKGEIGDRFLKLS